MTTQLTDYELNQMMNSNNLEIVRDSENGRWVLNRKVGSRTMFLKSSEFKTLLYWAVKKIEQRRTAKQA